MKLIQVVKVSSKVQDEQKKFLNSLIIQKPKTKEIMHRDMFEYLMKNPLFP